MGNGVIYIIKVPFKLVGAIIKLLDNIGEKVSETPDFIFDKEEHKKKLEEGQQIPSNIFSGLF